MPGPTEIVRAAVELPIALVRLAWRVLPLGGSDSDADIRVSPTPVPPREADWGPPEPPDVLVDDHVEVEVEVVAESADPEVEEGPGPELHVDDRLRGGRP